jgi:glutamate-ammonia-ligase adenylyltransferase
MAPTSQRRSGGRGSVRANGGEGPPPSGNFRKLIGVRPLPRSQAEKLLRAHGFHEPSRVHTALRRLCEDEIQRANLRKIFPHLFHACAKSADPDRAVVSFERLVSALPNASMFYHYLQEAPDRLDLLVTIGAHSQALADTLTRNARYFHFLIAPATLDQPRAKAWLVAELSRQLLPIRLAAPKCDVIRSFRRRETLRIGARDLTGRATVEETTRELSNLADVCLQAVYEVALAELRAKFKIREWPADARFVVIGMGKLGGQELNYSSDVDVIFVTGGDGQLTPQLAYQEFFTKLAEEIIRAMGASSNEGSIFRIDLRLRPEGSTGPLVRSLDGCENYYAESGETWERMALIKARPVAGDPVLGEEFLTMVQPFVYARHGSGTVVQQMAVLKERIEQEIVREDRLTRHVKLGIGGIREIEFIVQSFQLLRGARQVMLRERGTLRALELLARFKMLTGAETTALANAYRFLRNVEHRLQMEMDLQTHTIPDEERALARLARSMGFDSVEDFFKAQNQHTGNVRKIYREVVAAAETSAPMPLVNETQLPETLAAAGFADVPGAMKLVESLLHGSGFVHVSQRTKELFSRLFPEVLASAQKVADPDAALRQFERFVSAYGSRGLLYEIMAGNPRLVEMLLRLGDASKFLADALAQSPDLFDEVCRGGGLAQPKNPDQMWQELTAANGNPLDVARRWKQSELVRIGVEDVMELVDLERTHLELTDMAETCLRFGLQEVRQGKLPFAVIGMGKLGGRELGYGADLDVLFVGGKDAIGTATRLMDFMGRHTPAGTLFSVDPRLRPDGEKGALASSLDAHRDYYRHRALLWERQALTKARMVAGNAALGEKFIAMVQEIVYARPLTVGEAGEIRQMRHRIETERGDQHHVEGEFKTGPGGLLDVEFVVQTLQLRHGHEHSALRTAHTLAALGRLTALGLVDEEHSLRLRQNYLFLRRVESVLRRQENASVSRIPQDEREQLMLAKRLGFANGAEFLKTYRQITRRTREVYEALMR